MKVAFHTLGCKVNQNDTDSLVALFTDKGYEIVPFSEESDIYVINTCVVTGTGESKSRQTIRRAIAANPGAVVVVTGCYAQTAPQVIEGIPGVNLILGMADRPRIVELVESFLAERHNICQVGSLDNSGWFELPPMGSRERTRAMLKIEEGCEDYCSYCIVPYARGKVRSMPPEQLVKAFENLLEQGFQEIVLTGIHLGSYGKDIGVNLQTVLEELLKINGNFRIRLGSLEPHDLGDALLETILNQPQVCQHLHIPLQSGSDRILRRMNRRYSRNEFQALVHKIRQGNSLMSVGTDLIVGFPGETATDFEETCQFLIEQEFSRIHVFKFSPRPGTPAANYPERVSGKIIDERSALVQQIATESAEKFARQFIGKQVHVLFEEQNDGQWQGMSGEYLRVEVTDQRHLKNQLLLARVHAHHKDQLVGILID